MKTSMMRSKFQVVTVVPSRRKETKCILKDLNITLEIKEYKKTTEGEIIFSGTNSQHSEIFIKWSPSSDKLTDNNGTDLPSNSLFRLKFGNVLKHFELDQEADGGMFYYQNRSQFRDITLERRDIQTAQRLKTELTDKFSSKLNDGLTDKECVEILNNLHKDKEFSKFMNNLGLKTVTSWWRYSGRAYGKLEALSTFLNSDKCTATGYGSTSIESLPNTAAATGANPPPVENVSNDFFFGAGNFYIVIPNGCGRKELVDVKHDYNESEILKYLNNRKIVKCDTIIKEGKFTGLKYTYALVEVKPDYTESEILRCLNNGIIVKYDIAGQLIFSGQVKEGKFTGLKYTYAHLPEEVRCHSIVDNLSTKVVKVAPMDLKKLTHNEQRTFAGFETVQLKSVKSAVAKLN